MTRANARTERFDKVVVFGQPMLFTGLRIDRDTVPEGLFVYEVRHDDDGEGDPVQICEHVTFNHWGTLISDAPIEMDSAPFGPYKNIEPSDWCATRYCSTLEEYLSRGAE